MQVVLAQVQGCLCPLTKSADILSNGLFPSSENTRKSTSQPFGMSSLLATHPSIYSFLPLIDLFISTIPFLCLTSPQICPVCITGTHCMASLKPNPQNGSGKASKVLGVRGGLPSLWKALAHLKFWTQHWSNRWGCALISVPGGLFSCLVVSSSFWSSVSVRYNGSTFNRDSCLTSVLWLEGTGTVVCIWAMTGRWLLVPVLDFKLDL